MECTKGSINGNLNSVGGEMREDLCGIKLFKHFQALLGIFKSLSALPWSSQDLRNGAQIIVVSIKRKNSSLYTPYN